MSVYWCAQCHAKWPSFRRFQTSLFSCYCFSCKFWFQLIQNNVRDRFQVLACHHLKCMCCLLGIWADSLFLDRFCPLTSQRPMNDWRIEQSDEYGPTFWHGNMLSWNLWKVNRCHLPTIKISVIESVSQEMQHFFPMRACCCQQRLLPSLSRVCLPGSALGLWLPVRHAKAVPERAPRSLRIDAGQRERFTKTDPRAVLLQAQKTCCQSEILYLNQRHKKKPFLLKSYLKRCKIVVIVSWNLALMKFKSSEVSQALSCNRKTVRNLSAPV